MRAGSSNTGTTRNDLQQPAPFLLRTLQIEAGHENTATCRQPFAGACMQVGWCQRSLARRACVFFPVVRHFSVFFGAKKERENDGCRISGPLSLSCVLEMTEVPCLTGYNYPARPNWPKARRNHGVGGGGGHGTGFTTHVGVL